MTVSTVIGASADEAWALLRDFGRMDAWFEGMPPAVIEDGLDPAQVGCVRRIEVDGQVMARERLVALDDAARRQVYAIVESVFGLSGYTGTITVTPVTDGDRAFVEWTGVFEADAADAEATAAMIRDSIYLPGLESLRKLLED
ncbi:SRPBCC family protein [Streptosporangium sp. DT93]|uniref:SRPBCC family protein n=1 Tax=Streptosporangium sp. DT93 TaxID=3393428 RepID=UPI003CF61415